MNHTFFVSFQNNVIRKKDIEWWRRMKETRNIEAIKGYSQFQKFEVWKYLVFYAYKQAFIKFLHSTKRICEFCKLTFWKTRMQTVYIIFQWLRFTEHDVSDDGVILQSLNVYLHRLNDGTLFCYTIHFSQKKDITNRLTRWR